MFCSHNKYVLLHIADTAQMKLPLKVPALCLSSDSWTMGMLSDKEKNKLNTICVTEAF